MVGYQSAGVTASALYYLVVSTLALACLFLLAELVERGRTPEASVLAITLEAYGDDEEPEHDAEVGVATPVTLALLGLAFVSCGLVIAGLPPLSGFVAKLAMITSILNPAGLGAAAGSVSGGSWFLVALLIAAGLAATIAMLRAGINIFWVPIDSEVPRIRTVEMAAVMMLITLCVVLTVLAGPAMAYMEVTSELLHSGAVAPALPDAAASVGGER
jgi:multicomponent K+:H+ antiporter subunit D